MSGLSDIFLAYANYDLKSDPKNIYKIYDEIKKNAKLLNFNETEINELKIILDKIICYFNSNNEELISNLWEDYKNKKSLLDDYQRDILDKLYIEIELITAKTVYGYSNGICETKCPMRSYIEESFGKEIFIGTDRIKCFQCAQLDFFNLLKKLSEGKPNEEIEEDLETLIYKVKEFTKWKDVKIDFGKKLEIKEEESWEPKSPFFIFKNDHPYPQFCFIDYWHGIIGYSLISFLQEKNDNNKRIKKCRQCNTFFIAKDSKRQDCYNKQCEKEYKKEYMQPYMRKKRNKDSPEFDSKYIK